MTPRFHRSAEMELAAAVGIGESRVAGLGADLLNEVEGVVSLSVRPARYRRTAGSSPAPVPFESIPLRHQLSSRGGHSAHPRDRAPATAARLLEREKVTSNYRLARP